MSDIPGRFSTPPSTPSVSTPTPIETKEEPFEVTIHLSPSVPLEATPLPRLRTSTAKPPFAQVRAQAQAQAPAQDDAHGCCFRGCWSCVGCACFGGFLGALFWARAATGH